MAGYLTAAELGRLLTDAEYAAEGHTYYGVQPDVTVSLTAGPDGSLIYEAKRGRSVAGRGVFDPFARWTWFGDLSDEGWARA